MADDGDWMEPAQIHWDAARGRKEFESGPEILARAMAMVAEETWEVGRGPYREEWSQEPKDDPPDAGHTSEIITRVLRRLKEGS